MSHTEIVRKQYGLPAPARITFVYGNDRRFVSRAGEGRDEQEWVAAFEYRKASDTSHEAPQLGVLYLTPGVSKREARRAIDQILRVFPGKPKPRRPPVRDWDRQFLRGAFEKAESLAGTFVSPVVLVEIASRVNQLVAKEFKLKPLSAKTIWRECRQWRIDTGRPVRVPRTYFIEKPNKR